MEGSNEELNKNVLTANQKDIAKVAGILVIQNIKGTLKYILRENKSLIDLREKLESYIEEMDDLIN